MIQYTGWRSPRMLLLMCGLALTIGLGIRHTMGLFLAPMSMDLNWGRQTFAYAMAAQSLIYGLAQPFTGMIADKWGAGRVMKIGAVIYAAGLALMGLSRTGWELGLSGGLLIGIAVSGVSFAIVYGAIGRAFPAEKRSMALGVAGAAGSFGQFAMLPYAQVLINMLGWKETLFILALTVLLIIPLSSALADDKPLANKQTIPEAMREAFTHKGFILLCSGYWVCGFQLMFISVHFPAYLTDQKMSPETGMMGLALIGLFNIFGSYTWGWLGGKYTKKYLLSLLYFTRAVAAAIFVSLPVTPMSVYVFGAVMGFLWLGTAPITSGLIGQIFGVRYLSTLTGLAFVFHQVGSFAGVALGGYLFDRYGSYELMWWVAIAAGMFATVINLPIDDRKIERKPAPAPA